MVSDEDEWDDYETGPFCQHWSCACDCERVCARCGVTCADHDKFDGQSCEEFVDQEGA